MIKEIKANKVSYGKHISKCSCVTFTKELSRRIINLICILFTGYPKIEFLVIPVPTLFYVLKYVVHIHILFKSPIHYNKVLNISHVTNLI